jgi:hypothetical protein
MMLVENVMLAALWLMLAGQFFIKLASRSCSGGSQLLASVVSTESSHVGEHEAEGMMGKSGAKQMLLSRG